MSTPTRAVGADVGGSSIKCALIDVKTGAFAGERFSAPTPAQDSTDKWLDALATLVAQVGPGHAPWHQPKPRKSHAQAAL
jgi:polyphosphate glucokinase